MTRTTGVSFRERFLRFSPGPWHDVKGAFSPGRVNLIGEHTDYNGGYVLPAAIREGTWCWARPRADHRWRFFSESARQVVTVTESELSVREDRGFANYPAGVVWAMRQHGWAISGADIYYVGNLPQGAGLSSSASLEVVTAFVLAEMSGLSLDRVTLATIAHEADTQYVGVPGGIMDQMAVALAEPGHALSLSAATLAYESVPVPLDGLKIVVTNSNKPHHLVQSPYQARRQECDHILASLRSAGWPITYLAQLTPDDYDRALAIVTDPVLRRRLHHIIWENERARLAPGLLSQARLAEFGEWMRRSHESLRDDYEVTGPELDTLAESAWLVPGCIGSRMTGAGFGGSTVSLVETVALDRFRATVGERYRRRFGYDPTFLVTELGPGVHAVNGEEWQA